LSYGSSAEKINASSRADKAASAAASGKPKTPEVFYALTVLKKRKHDRNFIIFRMF